MAFLEYKPKNLAKVNALRRTISQPDIYVVPILKKGQVGFVSAADMHNEPASCANCIFYNVARSCQLIGPHVIVRKFVHGAPDKPIEFWPCCSMQQYGDPNSGPEKFIAENDPTAIDLCWINAPKVGVEHGGANCGGENGGDDCDYYMADIEDKRAAPQAFCRVLQCTVSNGDVCSAWNDDDRVDWQEAQAILRTEYDDPNS